jgi:hypothetical protein
VRDTLFPAASRATQLPIRHRDEPLDATLIQTTPETEVGGILAAANGEGQGLTVTNSRRRNAFLTVYQTSYTDTEGTHAVTDPKFHLITHQQLIWGTSGLAGILGSIADAANGTVVYSPVTSGPFNLDMLPADATQAEYRIEVIANGLPTDPNNLIGGHLAVPGEITPVGLYIKIESVK